MMNKRIQELAKEAVFAFEKEGIILPLVLEKFAELVIQDFVSRLKKDTNAWVDSLNLTSQDEMNKIYTEQLARQIDEEWYWAIK